MIMDKDKRSLVLNVLILALVVLNLIFLFIQYKKLREYDQKLDNILSQTKINSKRLVDITNTLKEWEIIE